MAFSQKTAALLRPAASLRVSSRASSGASAPSSGFDALRIKAAGAKKETFSPGLSKQNSFEAVCKRLHCFGLKTCSTVGPVTDLLHPKVRHATIPGGCDTGEKFLIFECSILTKQDKDDKISSVAARKRRGGWGA